MNSTAKPLTAKELSLCKRLMTAPALLRKVCDAVERDEIVQALKHGRKVRASRSMYPELNNAAGKVLCVRRTWADVDFGPVDGKPRVWEMPIADIKVR